MSLVLVMLRSLCDIQSKRSNKRLLRGPGLRRQAGAGDAKQGLGCAPYVLVALEAVSRVGRQGGNESEMKGGPQTKSLRTADTEWW